MAPDLDGGRRRSRPGTAGTSPWPRRLADAAVRAGAGFEAALLQAEVAVLQGRGAGGRGAAGRPPPAGHRRRPSGRGGGGAGRIPRSAAWAGPTRRCRWPARPKRLRHRPRRARLSSSPSGPSPSMRAGGCGRRSTCSSRCWPEPRARPLGLRLVHRRRVPGPHRPVRRGPALNEKCERARADRTGSPPLIPSVAEAVVRCAVSDRRRPAAGRRGGGRRGVRVRGGQRVRHHPGACSPCTWPGSS